MKPIGNRTTGGAGAGTASERLDAAFSALADPTRRAILARLALGDATVAELAAPFAMTQPAVSKHLRVLELAGLVSHERDAQRRPRRLEPRRMAEAAAWLEGYRKAWEAQFRGLDEMLLSLQGGRRVARAFVPPPRRKR